MVNVDAIMVNSKQIISFRTHCKGKRKSMSRIWHGRVKGNRVLTSNAAEELFS